MSEEAKKLQDKGVAAYQKKNYEQAVQLFNQASQAYEAAGAKDKAVEMQVNIGLVHRALGMVLLGQGLRPAGDLEVGVAHDPQRSGPRLGGVAHHGHGDVGAGVSEGAFELGFATPTEDEPRRRGTHRAHEGPETHTGREGQVEHGDQPDEGTDDEPDRPAKWSNVIDLMAALKKSLGDDKPKARPAVKKGSAKPAARRTTKKAAPKRAAGGRR